MHIFAMATDAILKSNTLFFPVQSTGGLVHFHLRCHVVGEADEFAVASKRGHFDIKK